MPKMTVTALAAVTLLALPAAAQQRPQIGTKKVDGTDNVAARRHCVLWGRRT